MSQVIFSAEEGEREEATTDTPDVPTPSSPRSRRAARSLDFTPAVAELDGLASTMGFVPDLDGLYESIKPTSLALMDGFYQSMEHHNSITSLAEQLAIHDPNPALERALAAATQPPQFDEALAAALTKAAKPPPALDFMEALEETSITASSAMEGLHIPAVARLDELVATQSAVAASMELNRASRPL